MLRISQSIYIYIYIYIYNADDVRLRKGQLNDAIPIASGKKHAPRLFDASASSLALEFALQRTSRMRC
jgi:hypothetical protein